MLHPQGEPAFNSGRQEMLESILHPYVQFGSQEGGKVRSLEARMLLRWEAWKFRGWEGEKIGGWDA